MKNLNIELEKSSRVCIRQGLLQQYSLFNEMGGGGL